MNPFRNEYELSLGGKKILLRPTFDNIAATEAAIGSISYLGYKYSLGHRAAKEAREKGVMLKAEDYAKTMPALSEMALIIFHNQAEKKFSMEEIWDLVQLEGIGFTNHLVTYISGITTGGDKTEAKETAASAEEKKS